MLRSWFQRVQHYVPKVRYVIPRIKFGVPGLESGILTIESGVTRILGNRLWSCQNRSSNPKAASWALIAESICLMGEHGTHRTQTGTPNINY